MFSRHRLGDAKSLRGRRPKQSQNRFSPEACFEVRLCFMSVGYFTSDESRLSGVASAKMEATSHEISF
ncbi:MAG: hypothetical protein WC454_04170 [Phycisphaerae bacterium]|jgi:hypothetical protein